MNVLRYLTFELNKDCPFSAIHPKCPSGHPERYKFEKTNRILTDDVVVEFWRWCRYVQGFRGIILWHMYSEPALIIDRIHALMNRIKREDPLQPFELFTSFTNLDLSKFDLYKVTDYSDGRELDNRVLAKDGEGVPYSAVQKTGWCSRGYGWELPIDFHGNWLLCCNDWRCEESVGNIFDDDWEEMFFAFKSKARKTRWSDKESYEAMPRMCRACIAYNFNLHRSGGIH